MLQDFKNYYKTTVIKTLWNQQSDISTSINGTEQCSNTDPHEYSQLIQTEEQKQFDEKSLVFPTNGTGAIGHIYAKHK